MLVAVWSLGPAGLYTLASLGQAALVERSLTVEVGFGRSLAFWIGAIYLALPLWGFLPARSTGWYARRSAIVALGTLGGLGVVASAVLLGLWLPAHWVGSVGVPVVGSIVVLALGAIAVLGLAGRQTPLAPQPPPPPPDTGLEVHGAP